MDASLVKKAVKGDRESFTQIVLEIKDQAYRVAYSYLQNEEDSMDAVCDAMEKAFRGIGKLKDERLFKTWFIRIVINESKLQLSRKKRTIDLADRLYKEQLTEVYENRDEGLDLKAVLKDLDRMERLIIYLKYFLGYSLEEIAEMVNLPLGTVKTKLYSNLKVIRAKLNYEEVHQRG